MNRNKKLYYKIKDVIQYNTLNTIQGPTVPRVYIIQNLTPEYTRREIENSLSMLRKNTEIFEIERDKVYYTLVEDKRLLACIEMEVTREFTDKRFIAKANKLRMKQ